jgi:hypothetical protein
MLMKRKSHFISMLKFPFLNFLNVGTRNQHTGTNKITTAEEPAAAEGGYFSFLSFPFIPFLAPEFAQQGLHHTVRPTSVLY